MTLYHLDFEHGDYSDHCIEFMGVYTSEEKRNEAKTKLLKSVEHLEHEYNSHPLSILKTTYSPRWTTYESETDVIPHLGKI